MKGIMYLVEYHQNDKRLYAASKNHGAAYEHGIATYALGETYAIARLGKRKLPGMKEAFEQGVQTIIDGQNPDGGLLSTLPEGVDTSVTGWQYQAFKAAKHTSLKFSGLSTSIKKAQQYLDDIQDRNNGMFPYRPGQPGKAIPRRSRAPRTPDARWCGLHDEIKRPRRYRRRHQRQKVARRQPLRVVLQHPSLFRRRR